MISARTKEDLFALDSVRRIRLHRGMPVQHKDELLYCPFIYMIPANRKDMRTAQEQPAMAERLSALQKDGSKEETIKAGDALQVTMMTFVTAGLLSEAISVDASRELEQTSDISDPDERAARTEAILHKATHPSDPAVLRFVSKDFDREGLLLADWSRIQTSYQALNHVMANEELTSFFGPVPE